MTEIGGSSPDMSKPLDLNTFVTAYKNPLCIGFKLNSTKIEVGDTFIFDKYSFQCKSIKPNTIINGTKYFIINFTDKNSGELFRFNIGFSKPTIDGGNIYNTIGFYRYNESFSVYEVVKDVEYAQLIKLLFNFVNVELIYCKFNDLINSLFNSILNYPGVELLEGTDKTKYFYPDNNALLGTTSECLGRIDKILELHTDTTVLESFRSNILEVISMIIPNSMGDLFIKRLNILLDKVNDRVSLIRTGLFSSGDVVNNIASQLNGAMK